MVSETIMPKGIYERTIKIRKKTSENMLKQWQNPVYKKHMVEVHKGHKAWNKGNHIQLNTGKTHFKKGQKSWNKGKICPQLTGKNNGSWMDGRSFEPYSIEFNESLKEQARKRDNYICRECNYTQEELGQKLDIHHIDYDKQNNCLDNLISLCRSCHAKTCFNRENWTMYYKNKTSLLVDSDGI